MVPAVDGSLLEARGLGFRHADGFELAVESFALGAGEVVALGGPSGAGKTTFLHLLAGLLPPSSGAVLHRGRSWRDMSEAERRRRRLEDIGLVFQEMELLAALPALQNVLLPRRLLGRDGAGVETEAKRLLERAGVGALAARRPERMSEGERRRVAVCRALLGSPAIVLADEPTANLDRESRRRVLDLLLEAAAGGAACLLVTHDPEVGARAGRRLRLEGGRLCG